MAAEGCRGRTAAGPREGGTQEPAASSSARQLGDRGLVREEPALRLKTEERKKTPQTELSRGLAHTLGLAKRGARQMCTFKDYMFH